MEKKVEEQSNLSQYVVRGGVIRCSLGTHTDVLNIPFSHGVLLKNQPQLNVSDCKSGTNIRCFGSCLSSDLKKDLEKDLKSDSKDDFESGLPPICTPTFSPGSKWINHQDTHLKIENEKALIQDATLQCLYAGKIAIITSGQ